MQINPSYWSICSVKNRYKWSKNKWLVQSRRPWVCTLNWPGYCWTFNRAKKCWRGRRWWWWYCTCWSSKAPMTHLKNETMMMFDKCISWLLFRPNATLTNPSTLIQPRVLTAEKLEVSGKQRKTNTFIHEKYIEKKSRTKRLKILLYYLVELLKFVEKMTFFLHSFSNV